MLLLAPLLSAWALLPRSSTGPCRHVQVHWSKRNATRTEYTENLQLVDRVVEELVVRRLDEAPDAQICEIGAK